MDLKQTKTLASVDFNQEKTLVSVKTSTTNGKFELFKGSNDEFYFRLIASNGRTILQSEGYVQEAGARNGIRSVKENGADPNNFEKRRSKDGKWYFVLKA